MANSEYDWIATDSWHTYQENLKSRYNDLEVNGWIDANITYKFNSHGFRCNDFSDQPSIVFLGCSHTFGVGLPVDNTWPFIVASSLNLKCYNLGIPGGSNDTAFRLSYYWLERINPAVVVLCLIEPSRFELIDNQSIIRFNPSFVSIPTVEQHYKDFYKTWVSTDCNPELNKEKNVLAITQICNRLNIELKVFDSSYFVDSKVDVARDLSHAGTVTNKNFANYVLTNL